MNNTIYYDANVSDDVRRQEIYDGQIFVYSPSPAGLAFIEHAKSMIEHAFGGLDPRIAQEKMPVEDYAGLLGKLKPAFIHHPESKTLIQKLLASLGCDLEKSYFDVPRMRSSTSGGYLTTGIAFAWHAHRDTWFSAPPSQINWWMPIYDIQPENCMAFHPLYWTEPVRNSSAGYNYYTWNKLHRGSDVAKLTTSDPRPLPRAVEAMQLDPQIRIVCPPGGVILFSAAQMHSSVPNTSGVTRFSIDFRTVHLGDVVAKQGAPNIDAECTGTVMRDFLRGTDFSPIPQAIISLYDDGSEGEGELVYKPQNTEAASS